MEHIPCCRNLKSLFLQDFFRFLLKSSAVCVRIDLRDSHRPAAPEPLRSLLLQFLPVRILRLIKQMLRFSFDKDQLVQIPEAVGPVYLIQVIHGFRIHANHQALRPSSLVLQTGVCGKRRGQRQKLRLMNISLVHAVQCPENAHLQVILRCRCLPRPKHPAAFHVIYDNIRIGSASIYSYSDHILKNSFSVFSLRNPSSTDPRYFLPSHFPSLPLLLFVFHRALKLQLIYKNILKAAL